MKAKIQNKKHVFLNRAVCIILILQGLLCGQSVYAQSTSATAGKEFYITYMLNYDEMAITSQQMKVVVSKACYITAKYNNQSNMYWNNWNNTLVQPGIYTAVVSKNDVMNGTTQISNKSITLTSTEDVNVYAINYRGTSTDGTCILPVSAWGTEYRLATGVPILSIHPALYAVVAKESGTLVTLHDNTTITLNQNQVYHYRHNTIADMTGMKISSTKPVAVYSGAALTAGPSEVYGGEEPLGSYTADHTYEQLWSVDKWGKDFFAWPILTPTGIDNFGGMVAIVAKENNTSVTVYGGINGGIPINLNLNAGGKEYVYHVMTGLTRILADKSIMVFLILPDASLMSIPATNQRIMQATVAPFILTGITEINAHGIDILVPAASWNQMVIKENGIVVSKSTYTVNTSAHFPEWYNIRKNLADADITIDLECPGGFLAYMSGSGHAESYSFMAGAGAYDLRNYFTVKEQATTIDTYYENTSSITHLFEPTDQIVVKRTVESAFTSISWLLNGVPYTITENLNTTNTLNFPASALSTGENLLTMSVRYLGATADSIYVGKVWLKNPPYIICRGETPTLTASLEIPNSVTNPVYRWYSTPTGGSPIGNLPTFTPSAPLTSDTIFYVSLEGDDYCEGERLDIYVAVKDCDEIVEKNATLLPNTFVDNGTYPNPVSVLGSEVVKYTISATNPAIAPAKILIIDTLPAYIQFVHDGTASPAVTPTNTTTPPNPVRQVLKWEFVNVPADSSRTVSFNTTPQPGSVASQPLFINHANVLIVRAPGDTIHLRTNGTYHQGAGISIMTFSAGFGGSIYNADEQALDYMTNPSSGVIIAPDEGYRFAGWSHGNYTSLRGATIKAQEGIMLYDTLTVYGNVELHASFELEEYAIAYHLNGGSNADANPSVYTVKSGAIALEAPQKEGDMFVGWTGSNGDEPQVNVVIPKGVTGELEFYANFLNSGREDIEPKASDNLDKVWTVEDDLYIRTNKPGSIVRIYSLDGVLREQQTIVSPGVTTKKLPRGIYVVTINNNTGIKVRIE